MRAVPVAGTLTMVVGDRILFYFFPAIARGFSESEKRLAPIIKRAKYIRLGIFVLLKLHTCTWIERGDSTSVALLF